MSSLVCESTFWWTRYLGNSIEKAKQMMDVVLGLGRRNTRDNFSVSVQYIELIAGALLLCFSPFHSYCGICARDRIAHMIWINHDSFPSLRKRAMSTLHVCVDSGTLDINVWTDGAVYGSSSGAWLLYNEHYRETVGTEHGVGVVVRGAEVVDDGAVRRHAEVARAAHVRQLQWSVRLLHVGRQGQYCGEPDLRKSIHIISNH